jgi:glutamate-1-semialdehyde 2,1-aminomutase
MPLSALVGAAETMRHIPSINYGMTFEGEAVSIAAGLATVSEMIEQDVVRSLYARGQVLAQEYRRLAQQHEVNTAIDGPEPCHHVHFADHDGLSARELRWLYIQEMVHGGVHTPGSFLLCYSHTEDDIAGIVEAFDRALGVVREAIDRETTQGLLHPGMYETLHAN